MKWGMEGFMQEMTDRSVLEKEKERERDGYRQKERHLEALREGHRRREYDTKHTHTCVRLSLPCLALPAAESPSTM